MFRLVRVPLFAAGLLAAGLLSCSDSMLESKVDPLSQLDDRLTLQGRVCTRPPSPSGFPVKVVVVIDESGSMCVSDPPGAQMDSGFCQRAEVQAIIPPGVTEPARVRALKRLVAQFRQVNAQGGNVQVSVAPFETNVRNVWPPSTASERFARPDTNIDSYIEGLQSQLGKGTDYQGALSYAYGVIASDIQKVSTENPELLPRTRYVVVFLTDGTPYPRCSANDNLSVYANPDNPDLTWADSIVSFCNATNTTDQIDGFEIGTDRNQNYQLFSYVRRLMELKDQYNVGDLRMHTVLLFNQEAVRACGPICQEIYGIYPGVPQAQYPEAAKKIASWLLKRFAEMGNGVYQEFNDTSEISNLGLGALDYSSFASRNVMKSLVVESLSSMPSLQSRIVDSDGDGVPDDQDNSVVLKTNPFLRDSDGDCLDDGFETRRADQGFKASNHRDSRGCDVLTAQGTCQCRDTDGDGLSQSAENFLRTKTQLVDSDGDGMPDSLEARWGLDPLTPNVAGLDTDGDGIPDDLELRSGSDPTRRDKAFFDKYGYQYETRIAEVRPDGSICYDFTISNLQLVSPQERSGAKQGFNLFNVWFAEAPESGVATDYGVWTSACAWAQYAPPSVRVPVGPELTFAAGDFRTTSNLPNPWDDQRRCIGTTPSGETR
ncbi:VWA domain-containing protein [Myxococcus sp. K15C18031901]|uniref:cell-cell cohesion protein MtsD n=1 Tax=Myxococcus dinghuensis TaxID=2906761 RepID=UPI0020A7F9C2|nr:VWA domain-containing protein [Myxococcus dinghuensis]MCP3105042.1 VWA domain-containing protein [Myxococcus dinghuensis]